MDLAGVISTAAALPDDIALLTENVHQHQSQQQHLLPLFHQQQQQILLYQKKQQQQQVRRQDDRSQLSEIASPWPPTSPKSLPYKPIALVGGCAICGDVSHGVHFGVTVCRACAAFFRRATVSGRKYRCRRDGKCDVGKDMRCCCRACRLEKCLALGMNADSVQRHRDRIGPRRHSNASSSGANALLADSESDGQCSDITTVSAKEAAKVNFYKEGSASEVLSSSTASSSPWISTTSDFSSNSSYTPSILSSFASTSSSPFTFSSASSAFSPTAQLLADGLPPVNDGGVLSTHQSLSATGALLRNVILGSGGTTLTNDAHKLPAAIPPPATSTLFTGSMKCYQPNAPLESQAHMATNSGGDTTIEFPLTAEISNGYRWLHQLRQSASSMFQPNNNIYKFLSENRELTVGNYAEHMNSVRSDLSLVSDMLNNYCTPLSKISINSRWTLLRNFFCSFVLIDRAFYTVKHFPNCGDPRIVVSPFHYMNTENVTDFMNVDECKADPQTCAETFKTLFDNYLRNLVDPFREMLLSIEETSALFGLLFWNYRLDLTQDENKIVSETQEVIYKELYTIVQRQHGREDYGIRFARICSFANHAYNVEQGIASNFSLLGITNSFSVDAFFHNFTPHSF